MLVELEGSKVLGLAFAHHVGPFKMSECQFIDSTIPVEVRVSTKFCLLVTCCCQRLMVRQSIGTMINKDVLTTNRVVNSSVVYAHKVITDELFNIIEIVIGQNLRFKHIIP